MVNWNRDTRSNFGVSLKLPAETCFLLRKEQYVHVSGVLKVCGRGTHGTMIYIFKNILIDFIYNVLTYVIFYVNTSRNCVWRVRLSIIWFLEVVIPVFLWYSGIVLTFVESPNHMSRPVISTQMELPLTYSRNSSKRKDCRAKPNRI